jgi:hypothetical protein
LDTARNLVLLQEEAVEPGRRRDFRRTDGSPFSKPHPTKGALPLPPPPPSPGAQAVPDGKKPLDAVRGIPKPPTVEDKLQTLRSYRKARGLCIRCGERWQPGHKCAPVIQLHALQEVWNLCQDAFKLPEASDAQATPTEPEVATTAAAHQLFLLSSAAVSAQPSSQTMQLKGTIGDQEVLILVDSGSSHSFISSTLASNLLGVQSLSSPVSVLVADGSSITCTQEVQMAAWSVQGYEFHSNLKIIPLGSYDMIVGTDWLSAFSPMKVHWAQKWMMNTVWVSTDSTPGQLT